MIAKSLRQQTQLSTVLLATYAQKPVSTASARGYHQHKFKQNLITAYSCQSPTTPGYLKCMVLDQFIRAENVIASHLVALKDENVLPLLGYSPEFKWKHTNGLLLSEKIDKAYENQEITFLLNPLNSTVAVRILYDDVLDRDVLDDYNVVEGYSTLSKKAKKQMRRLKFRDLDGAPLHLPPLVFPSRRVLFWASKSAYLNALVSDRQHSCAERSQPDWDAIAKFVKDTSPGDSDCALLTTIFGGDNLGDANSDDDGDEIIEYGADENYDDVAVVAT